MGGVGSPSKTKRDYETGGEMRSQNLRSFVGVDSSQKRTLSKRNNSSGRMGKRRPVNGTRGGRLLKELGEEYLTPEAWGGHCRELSERGTEVNVPRTRVLLGRIAAQRPLAREMGGTVPRGRTNRLGGHGGKNKEGAKNTLRDNRGLRG